MSFPCTACGLCCKVGPRLVEGWPLREDGACIHLRDDNTCEIYGTRPDICRVNVMQERSGIPEEEYFRLTASICNDLQDAAGIDPRFRVNLP